MPFSPALAAPPAARPVKRLDGSSISAEDVTRAVTSLMKSASVPGLGLTILEDERVVYLKAFGLRDVEKGLPLTPESVMPGASLTKAAFATLALQLVDHGVLDLDRPIVDYLTKPLAENERFRDLAGDRRLRCVTVRILLSHTSGLPNLRQFEPDKKLRFNFEPGTRYAYSGEGINLLQLVIEEITGQPVAELMQERVFDRYGMARTSMIWQPAFDTNFAIGYDEEGHAVAHEKRSRANAAGSMETTIQDMGKFLQGVMRGSGLSAATKREMTAPQIPIFSRQQFPTLSSDTTLANRAISLSYGLGWGVFRSRFGPAYFKEGHDEGWESHAVCFGDKKIGIAIMTNSANGDRIFMSLLNELLGDKDTPWSWEGYAPAR
ncbi:MAG: serine hydrolase domain-containing protein [Thermoanaerobaculia bacterium]